MTTKKSSLLSKINLAIIIGIIIAIVTSPFTAFAKECDEIRENVLRLHILANSNSDEDQALKLKVRDKILALDSALFENIDNFTDAKEIAQNSLNKIINIAQQEVYNNGYSYKVNAEVCNMYFNTRDYDGFSMPAGKYDAVRITIGEAKGKNWWCVLYPALCLPAASPKNEMENKLSDEQIDILSNKNSYEFRFASVEFFEKLKHLLFD